MTATAIARPATRSPEIVREAAEKLAAECVEWAGSGAAEDWVEDLIRCGHYWSNGYELAKELDKRCHVFGIDMELVEILDGASSALNRAHEAAVKRWVEATGFEPAFSVGDVVECQWGVGPIQRIEAEKAQYIVSTTNRDWGLGGGYVINAEDLTAASVDERPEGQDAKQLGAQHASAVPKADAQPTVPQP